ncbi:hypothetical protein FQN57_001104 [Myotisia sp. PD_48]|nr:hypothetical protein FQN57_001104 [Myotisia sp. PD_48]
MHLNSVILGALCAAGSAMAHMEMITPYALKSQYDPKNDWSNIDYDNTSPLNSDGSNYPCRGHLRNTPWRTVATWGAGSSATVKLSQGNTHRGGSCQLSLSYDNGSTFKVIKSIMGGCPLAYNYSFSVPSSVPSGKAIFAWSWFNLEGNREMYMNCAHVEITGGSRDTSAFAALPDIFKANVGGSCRTVEGKETVFANPGAVVEYGGSLHHVYIRIALKSGNAYKQTIQKFQILKVVLSCATLRNMSDLPATLQPITAKPLEIIQEQAQYQGQKILQNIMGIAIVHLAAPSPITSGTVLRPITRSPAWSYMSCACTVVKTIAPITPSQFTISRLNAISRPPSATSKGAEI